MNNGTMLKPKMYNIFNMKGKSSKKAECDDFDDEVNVDEPAELPDPEQIKCDVIDVNILLDLGTLESGPVRPILKISGCKDAKNNKTKLQIHALSDHHLTAMTKWLAYNSAQKTGSIVSQMSTANHKQINENREYIKCLIEIILYLGRQGISLRGHRENEESLNKGNFKEMCYLISKFNPEFAKKFQNNLTNHTSWLIQNDLIYLCASKIKETIINEIKYAGMFSIQCDEARCHHEEQLAICIRYPKNLSVCERFVEFVNVSKKQDADALVKALLNFIYTSNLSEVPIIGQSYDGAAVMSGSEGGVQSKLRQNHPPASKAIYIHCMAHKLNLVIVDMCKHLKDARSLFNGLQALYVHFSYPTTSTKLIEMQNKLNLKKTKICQLSDTRWVCRYKSCDAVLNNFEAIICILTEEIEAQESKDVAQAIGVLATMKNVKFVVYLFILHEVLRIVNILSTQLQAKSATLGNSANLVKGIISTLKTNRSSCHFNEIWDGVITFCDTHNISIRKDEPKRQRKEPTFLKGFDVTIATGAEENNRINDEKTYWKTTAFFPIVDAVIFNMKRRFSEESFQMATSIDKLFKMDFEGSHFIIDHYKDVFKLNTENLKCEMTVFKNIIKENTEFEHIKEHLSKQVFPNLFKVVQIAITLPVSSATSERSFSTMRRINTYLRSTMSQNRFCNLSILNIEKDIVVDVEEILNTFSKTERRIKLL